jgi:hypothetical protein
MRLAVVGLLLPALAHADRVIVPSVQAGVGVGGASLTESATFAAAMVAWEAPAPVPEPACHATNSCTNSLLAFVPEVGVLGMWSGRMTPLALAGGRLDLALRTPEHPLTFSLGARAGIATDIGGVHPAWDTSIAVQRGFSGVQLGLELALTGFHATAMMGGDPMPADKVYTRFGLTLAAPL